MSWKRLHPDKNDSTASGIGRVEEINLEGRKREGGPGLAWRWRNVSERGGVEGRRIRSMTLPSV